MPPNGRAMTLSYGMNQPKSEVGISTSYVPVKIENWCHRLTLTLAKPAYTTPTESCVVSHGLTNIRLDPLKPMYIDATRVNKRPIKKGTYILFMVEY